MLCACLQVQWQGTVLQAGQTAYFHSAVVMMAFSMLAHKTRRVPLFNTLLTAGHLREPWAASWAAFPLLLMCGLLLVYSRCAVRLPMLAAVTTSLVAVCTRA